MFRNLDYDGATKVLEILRLNLNRLLVILEISTRRICLVELQVAIQSFSDLDVERESHFFQSLVLRYDLYHHLVNTDIGSCLRKDVEL